MYMHEEKRDLLWQTRIITEVYFFVVDPSCEMRCGITTKEIHFRDDTCTSMTIL